MNKIALFSCYTYAGKKVDSFYYVCRFVIVACDGLWKCFDPDASVKFVNKILQDSRISSTESKSAEHVRFDSACNKLANESVLRLSGDNVTVLILAIGSQP